MGESTSVDNLKSDMKSKIPKLFPRFVKESLAIFLWGYVTVKLFIFDIDNYLIEKFFPNYIWLVNFKFFILTGIVAIILLVTKNKNILLWSLYIFFYPIILLFWKIPVFIFKTKSWNLAIAFIDSIISFYKSFKITFITTSFFLMSLAIVLWSYNTVFLWFAIVALSIILLIVYLQKIVLMLRPSSIYQAYSRFFSFAGKNVRSNPIEKMDESITVLSIESMDEDQIKIWITHVEQLVLFNRICFFVAKKLKSYQDSGFNVVSSIFIILLLILYTVFTFAIINFGLFKIDHSYYAFPNTPSLFTFFYYSFNILIFNQIQEIVSITFVSQTASMIEEFYALFLIAIFASLMFSVRSQRVADDLNAIMKQLMEEGVRVEEFIKDNYKLDSIEDAMRTLQKLKTAMIDFLYKITEALTTE